MAKNGTVGPRRGREYYEKWFERRDREGWTLRQLAEKSGLSLSTVTRWSARLRHERDRFAEVTNGDVSPEEPRRVAVLLRSGRSIMVPEGFDPAALAALVQVLDSGC
jgi:transposase